MNREGSSAVFEYHISNCSDARGQPGHWSYLFVVNIDGGDLWRVPLLPGVRWGWLGVVKYHSGVAALACCTRSLGTRLPTLPPLSLTALWTLGAMASCWCVGRRGFIGCTCGSKCRGLSCQEQVRGLALHARARVCVCACVCVCVCARQPCFTFLPTHSKLNDTLLHTCTRSQQ